MKKICIATNFNSADPAYSLNRVTQDQIKMLVDAGIKPVVIVSEHFKPIEAYKLAEIRKIPAVNCHNSIKKDDTFDADVTKLAEAFEKHLADIDIVISHDFVYQPAALKHNIACRKVAQKHPEKRWLHWIHSATPPFTLATLRPFFQEEYLKIMEKPFPNSFYIAFNNISTESLARNFNVGPENVKVVPHPIDLAAYYGFDEVMTKLFKEKELGMADAICAYPIRLDRGKQVEYVIKTMAELKKFNMKVKCIVIDFHSTGGDKVTYREELKNLGIDLKLTPNELIFTSEFDEKWKTRVPWEQVCKLLQFSNVYIHPSRSETYSLTTQEAAAGGAVVVLNQDFPPYRDIYGPNAIYKKYSSNWNVIADLADAYNKDSQTNTNYGPNDAPEFSRKDFETQYHHGTAAKIAYHLRYDPSLALQSKIRMERSLKAVFRNHLEPLIYAK